MRRIAVEVPDDNCRDCRGFDTENILSMIFCNIFRHPLYKRIRMKIYPCDEYLKATIKENDNGLDKRKR